MFVAYEDEQRDVLEKSVVRCIIISTYIELDTIQYYRTL